MAARAAERETAQRTRRTRVGLARPHSNERKRIEVANGCMVNTFAVVEQLSERDGIYIMEHPEDPGE